MTNKHRHDTGQHRDKSTQMHRNDGMAISFRFTCGNHYSQNDTKKKLRLLFWSTYKSGALLDVKPTIPKQCNDKDYIDDKRTQTPYDCVKHSCNVLMTSITYNQWTVSTNNNVNNNHKEIRVTGGTTGIELVRQIRGEPTER